MRARLAAVALAAALALAGCGALSKLLPGHPKTTSLKTLRVIAQPGANLDSATALDLVFVYDPASTALLPKTGPAWFAQKAALLNGLGRNADVVSLQLPPATVVDSVALPARGSKAIAVLGFANYLAPDGQGRIDLSRSSAPVIWLAPARITVTDEP
jgi:type VI secretion system protein